MDDLIEALLARLEQRVGVNEPLWTANEVAEYLKVDPRQVKDRYSRHPDFPAGIKLPSAKGQGQFRWVPKQVREWAEKKAKAA